MNREIDRRGPLLHMGGYVNLFLHISLFLCVCVRVCVCMFDFNLFDFICYFLCVEKKTRKYNLSIYDYLYKVDVCGC